MSTKAETARSFLRAVAKACADKNDGTVRHRIRNLEVVLHCLYRDRDRHNNSPPGYTMRTGLNDRQGHSLALSPYLSANHGPAPAYMNDVSKMLLLLKGHLNLMLDDDVDFILSRTNGGLVIHAQIGRHEYFGNTLEGALASSLLHFTAEELLDTKERVAYVCEKQDMLEKAGIVYEEAPASN